MKRLGQPAKGMSRKRGRQFRNSCSQSCRGALDSGYLPNGRDPASGAMVLQTTKDTACPMSQGMP